MRIDRSSLLGNGLVAVLTQGAPEGSGRHIRVCPGYFKNPYPKLFIPKVSMPASIASFLVHVLTSATLPTMWTILKTAVGALVFGAFAYCTFFVDLGGQTLAGHFVDIWRAPVVQEKIEQAREGVKKELEDRLADAGSRAGRKAAHTLTEPTDELTETDRRELEEVLEKVSRAP
ncbi:hypothetical protein ACFL6C_08610 [Myxococcota bacterium]